MSQEYLDFLFEGEEALLFWKFAKEELHELLGRHGGTIRVPEGGDEHILDVTRFAIGELNFDFGWPL